jgi:CDP-glycerol glycerophosphotransferase (TagB/SpsB family)
MRAIEAHNGYAQKNLIEHGYTRLDDILRNASTPPTAEYANALGAPQPIHVLIAPSWGQFGTIESGLAFNIIDDLLARGFQVTLRPHPQTSRFHGYEISRIRDKFNSQALFFLEDNVAGQESLHASDLMVGDWSGAALDYAFGLKKPVIFIDIPKKVNDPDYIKIDLEPIEIGVRQEIGVVVSPECQSLPIEECLETDINALDISRYVYNVGRSGSVGAHAILKLLQCETR